MKFILNPTGRQFEGAADDIQRSHRMLLGDLGRGRADGKLVVEGRVDDMIKLNGR